MKQRLCAGRLNFGSSQGLWDFSFHHYAQSGILSYPA
jgi:hypothetical protein